MERWGSGCTALDLSSSPDELLNSKLNFSPLLMFLVALFHIHKIDNSAYNYDRSSKRNRLMSNLTFHVSCKCLWFKCCLNLKGWIAGLRLFRFRLAACEMTQKSAWMCVTEPFPVVPLLTPTRAPHSSSSHPRLRALLSRPRTSGPALVDASEGFSRARSTAERNRMRRLHCQPAGVSANRWGNAGAGTPKLWLPWRRFASRSPAISLQLFSFHDRPSKARRTVSGDWRDALKDGVIPL